MVRRIATAITAMILLAGCASGGMTTGPTLPTGRIEPELQRGASTKMDVRRVLGPPNGSGSALFPSNSRPRDIWVYVQAQTGAVEYVGGGRVRVASRGQFLAIFFLDDVFDGFMWYERADAVKTSP